MRPEWLDARRKPLQDNHTVSLILCDHIWTGGIIYFRVRRYFQITALDHQNDRKLLLEHVARQNYSFLHTNLSDRLRLHS
jgi:hypothetical protein